MKKIITLLSIICLLCSAANASVLLTASPLGQGKIGLAGALGGVYNITSPFTPQNSPAYGLAGLIGYGLTNELDIYGKAGYSTMINLPAGTDSVNGSAFSGVLKYALLKESSSMPVSVAVAAGYSAASTDISYLSGAVKMQAASGDLGIGVITSKVMVPFVPYAALASHSYDTKVATISSTKTQNWELALGSYMFLSRSTAIVAEWSTAMQIDQQPSTAITIGYMQTL